MKRSVLILFLLGLSIIPSPVHSTPASKLVIVLKGVSRHRIAIAANASTADRLAAGELQKYIRKISGVELPVLIGFRAAGDTTIRIASAGHAAELSDSIAWDMLEEDGFVIRTTGNGLVIAGGREKGSLYGVFTLLETYLGCRLYGPEVEIVPRQTTITLPRINETQVPKIRFRDAYFYEPGYMEWHKLDNHADLFGMYVHTFRRLVPPEMFFQDHPEFFSLAKSGRIPDAQLCLTNPDVLRIVIDSLRGAMRRRPLARWWSVSQNDTYSPCMCDACRAIDEAEGSPSGSLLAFVNRVASQFPDKIISTLAYQYSRAAPKNIRPLSNVNVMLCSIECNRSKPLSTDPAGESFRRDVAEWTRLTKNIYLWDYVVQFRNLMNPFPNLRVLQPNIQYFVRSGIRAVFEQGSGGLISENKELRTYLIAKLLWNPDINVDSLITDFTNGYYGAAGKFIKQYIDEMHDALERSGEDLWIYGYPLPSEKGYLSASMLDRYGKIFDSAEKAVRDEPGLLARVRTARLPLQFVLLEQAKILGTAPRGFFISDGEGWRVKPDMQAMLDTFVVRCRRAGITALEEMGTSPDQYLQSTRKFLSTSMHRHLAFRKTVTLAAPASPKYHNGDRTALTDGLRGWEDYHMHWLGFEGEDMEATVDLGKETMVRKVGTSFLQDNNSWIFLPLRVDILVSMNGKEFVPVGHGDNSIPAATAGSFITPSSFEFEPVTARYIRVRAVNMKQCPDWHKGAGGKAWIFADEIVVE